MSNDPEKITEKGLLAYADGQSGDEECQTKRYPKGSSRAELQ
jgi:hypothetical protein